MNVQEHSETTLLGEMCWKGIWEILVEDHQHFLLLTVEIQLVAEYV